MFLVVLLLLSIEIFKSEVELFSYFFLVLFPCFLPSYSQTKASAEESSQIVNPSEEGGVTVLCRKYVVNLNQEITVNKEI